MTRESLPVDELHSWFIRFDELRDAESRLALTELLDLSERERMARFVFERDRRIYVLAHVLVRTMLSRFADVAPGAWRFEANAHGKPSIVEPVGYEWLKFNLSHTRAGALCGVVRDAEIGVDIETMERATQCVELADRYFSPTEAAALHRAPVEQQRETFFRFWTLKEAYIKARGLGLAIPLDHFSFDLAEGGAPISTRCTVPPTISFKSDIQDVSARWQFAELDCGMGLPAAIAVDRGDVGERRIVLRQVTELPQA
jgi:4'-phosphopantetheinyl transferase